MWLHTEDSTFSIICSASEVSDITSRWCRITKTRKNKCTFLNKFIVSRYILASFSRCTHKIYTPQTLLHSVSEIVFRKVTKSAGRIDSEATRLDQICHSMTIRIPSLYWMKASPDVPVSFSVGDFFLKFCYLLDFSLHWTYDVQLFQVAVNMLE